MIYAKHILERLLKPIRSSTAWINWSGTSRRGTYQQVSPSSQKQTHPLVSFSDLSCVDWACTRPLFYEYIHCRSFVALSLQQVWCAASHKAADICRRQSHSILTEVVAGCRRVSSRLQNLAWSQQTACLTVDGVSLALLLEAA